LREGKLIFNAINSKLTSTIVAKRQHISKNNVSLELWLIILIMSRSRKKPIVKDKTGHKWYNRLIKRAVRQVVRQIKYLKDKEDYTIPHLYEKINQYDICDWWFDCSNNPKAYRK
jgi:hypothetical protein